MRSAPATLLGLVLLVMLAATTPTGTGDGLHQNQLLHPLFTHVHLINGHFVSHATGTPEPVQRAPGVAMGAGTPLGDGGDGLGMVPALPALDLQLVFGAPRARAGTDVKRPSERLDAPPDPPPTSRVSG